MLYLTNTMSGRKERFTSIRDNEVLLYVCGITPYSPAHIGHGRCYISFDVAVRLLQLLGYSVNYCRNFTDIDDKLLNKAQELFGDPARYTEVAQENIASFTQQMHALNCLPPTAEPRVTTSIDLIINFIQTLLDKKHAYVSQGSVYFDVSSDTDYGKLSHQDVQQLRAGTRTDVREEKDDVLDFALWKAAPTGVSWPSPWGPGRPGWHIECSAMAQHHLGNHIDIHAGGLDLIFPHHENEIAQSESALGQPFARYWLHNSLVTIGQEKMAKSLGNALSLHDLITEWDPMVLRYYILAHHYRSPLEFLPDGLSNAQKAYQRIIAAFASTEAASHITYQNTGTPVSAQLVAALCDDLNTPAFFGILFEHLAQLKNNHPEAPIVKALLQTVLGLTLQPLAQTQVGMTPEIIQLIAEREQARAEKNWARADELRAQLCERGFVVQDKKRT